MLNTPLIDWCDTARVEMYLRSSVTLARLASVLTLFFLSDALARGYKDMLLPAESRLISELRNRYEKIGILTRPVANSSRAVNITFGLELIQILDLNEISYTLKTLIWKRMQWVDEHLTWNPDEYGGVDHLRLSPKMMWTPDIALYNNIGENKKGSHVDMLQVTHNGSISWIPVLKYDSSCPVDMDSFPFDVQTCSFTFGPWANDLKQVDVHFDPEFHGFSLRMFNKNAGWDIIQNSAYRTVIHFPCCSNQFVQLRYSLTLRRKPKFHLETVICPVVLLSCLTAAIFWIPPHRPDRTGMGMSTFAAFSLLLLVVVNSTPPSSSKLGLFISTELLAVSVITIFSVAMVILANQDKPPHGGLYKVVVCYLGRLLCVTGPQDCQRIQAELAGLQQTETSKTDLYDGTGACNTEDPSAKKVSQCCYLLGPRRQWRLVINVCDRLCFTLYLLYLALSAIFIFPRPS